MSFWNSLSGKVTVELTSADPSDALLELQRANVVLQDLENAGQLQYRFTLGRSDVKRVQRITRKRGETLRILERDGLFWTVLALRKRPVLVLGILALLVFSLWVPGRVFFVRVEGNLNVPAAQIIEQAEKSGIGFGASRREVRSEKMKNLLLDRMPQLQWAGVNTYGCVAVITVRERSDPDITEDSPGVSSIVASQDALIREMTVLQGSALCKPGQAVKAGQVLVSGYTDCGIYIQAQQAKAEIFGQTRRQLSAVIPLKYQYRQENTGVYQSFSLILGKNRINLWKDSGNLGSSCAKIVMDYDLTLPGGFVLPVRLSVETVYVCHSQTNEAENAQAVLDDFAQDYLAGQMVAGKVQNAGQVIATQGDICRLDGIYDCYEMIGITRIEENLGSYGENN